MDKRIRFGTKEESNASRGVAFLALSPSERFALFLRSFNTGRGRARRNGHNTANFIISNHRDPLR